MIIAIDGRCASGKTSFAHKLQQRLCCNVIHMDHFFLPPEKRSAERLAEPGGNVDYERFLEQVLFPLKKGEAFSYRPFDCSLQDYGQPIDIFPGAVTIIEGSYSCHPLFREYYDLTIFLTVAPEEQLARILRRNGADAVAVFRDKWIPLEETYFTAHRIAEACDIYSDTTGRNRIP